MSHTRAPIEGEVIEAGQLRLPRAASIAAAASAQGSFASLVECRAASACETVVFDVEVERPQYPAADIRRVERIAARLTEADDTWPEVFAMRDDFPIVPHLAMGAETMPRGLCLYDRSWPEIRPSWTGASFIERVRWWLARTARGELHEAGQPLEPLMFSHGFDLVISSRFGLDGGPLTETVRVVLVDGREGRVLVADEPGTRDRGGRLCLAIYIETPARTHGVIQRTPGTLQGLAELVDLDQFRLVERLAQALREIPEWIRKDVEQRRSLSPLFVLGLPKTRRAEGAVEWVELKGFHRRRQPTGRPLVHTGQCARHPRTSRHLVFAADRHPEQ